MSEDATKKRKKTEDDVTELITRYSPSAMLSLLQEINEYTIKHPNSAKIDWNELFKTTSTGISSARECQMLWRNLAYNMDLSDVEKGTELLDDDSDLEIEMEPNPTPSAEESVEAKEHVKVLLSSSTPRICGSTSQPMEATLDADMHNGSTLLDSLDKHASSNCGGNTSISNANKKPPTGLCDDALDGNGQPSKKKRQPWTKEEDDELKEAVRKCGEGNWANILKGDFKHNRTAAQLSQRWALLRKKDGNSNMVNGNKNSSTTRNEERLAVNKALNIAVDMPMTGSISSLYPGTTHTGNSSTSSAATSQASRACAAQSLNHSQDKTIPNIFTKPRPPIKKPSFPSKKPSVGPNPLIQAAAFAAGGRIANPSTAASLMKAAQSKNAVRIGPVIQVSSNITSNTKSTPTHLIRPSSTQVSTNLSFGTTLSSMRLLDSKAKAAENVEEKKSVGSDNSNDVYVEELVVEAAATKESNTGKSETVVENEVVSDTEGTKIEGKESKASVTEQKEVEAPEIKESYSESNTSVDSKSMVDGKSSD